MAESKVEHLLDSIHFPEDLRHLSQDKLEQVCADLRQYIIDVLSENPGHLGASLGTVELTVALHYVFNTPYDRIVWDVGHQAYGHKILTGRKDIFHTLRKFKGISGFPNPAESEYDAFIAGHASNSISAAMGMSVASALKKELDRHVIAVIGDGAMTGGLAFEGLNNASANPNNLLIILNDNDMAIDHSVGGLSQYLVDKLEALLETAGGVCVGSVLQNRETPEARTFIGEGKVAEVAALVQAQGADLVVFDNELSPSQQRVLTEEVGAQVIDRAGLIDP